MQPSSRTPEGEPNRCPICGHHIRIEPSSSTGDAPCPSCGQLLWFPALSSPDEFNFWAGHGTIYELDVTCKLDTIQRLVSLLIELGHLRAADASSIVTAIMDREELASTGIGNGIAVPHAQHAGVAQFIGIIGHVRSGIDFDSLDGQPVTKLFLLLSPLDQPNKHLRALEQISKRLRTSTI